MINNRLFKKINSIFWGILSWLPAFVTFYFVLCYSISIDVIDITNFNFGNFFNEIIAKSTDSITLFNNHLLGLFISFLDVFDVSLAAEPFTTFVIVVLSWFCMVQVFRLLSYVFVWFIDLIISLFDLMTFNRKGDN